jgi:6-phospho-3-hexuloisomerase
VCAADMSDGVGRTMEPTETIRRVWMEVGEVLAQVEQADVTLFVNELLEAKRVFVTGEGRSGLVGKCFAMRLMHLGLLTHCVGEVATPPIGPGDLLVAISGSGSTPVILTVTEQALAAGAKVFLISSKRASPIGRLAHHVLVVPGKAKVDTVHSSSIQPMGSLAEQSVHLLLDAVVVMLMYRLGVKAEEMRARHTNL